VKRVLVRRSSAPLGRAAPSIHPLEQLNRTWSLLDLKSDDLADPENIAKRLPETLLLPSLRRHSLLLSSCPNSLTIKQVHVGQRLRLIARPLGAPAASRVGAFATFSDVSPDRPADATSHRFWFFARYPAAALSASRSAAHGRDSKVPPRRSLRNSANTGAKTLKGRM